MWLAPERNASTILFRVLDQSHNLVKARLVDQWADHELLAHTLIDFDFGDLVDYGRGKAIVDFVLHINPIG
jgi:hypothetical protein